MRGRTAYLAPHRVEIRKIHDMYGTIRNRSLRRRVGRYLARGVADERRHQRHDLAAARRKPLLNNGGKS